MDQLLFVEKTKQPKTKQKKQKKKKKIIIIKSKKKMPFYILSSIHQSFVLTILQTMITFWNYFDKNITTQIEFQLHMHFLLWSLIEKLSFATLWANSANDKMVIFFLFFPENKLWHFVQINLKCQSLFSRKY